MNHFFQSNNSLQKLNEETLKYSQELSKEGVVLVTELSLNSAMEDKKKLTAEIRKQKNAAKKNKGNAKELKTLEEALEGVRTLIDALRGRGLSKADKVNFNQHHFEDRLNYIADAMVAYHQHRRKLQMTNQQEVQTTAEMNQALLKYLALMHHDFIERARLVNFLHKSLGRPDEAQNKIAEFRHQAEVLNNQTQSARQDTLWLAFLTKVNNTRVIVEKPQVEKKSGFVAQGLLARQLDRLRQQHNRHSTFKSTMKR